MSKILSYESFEYLNESHDAFSFELDSILNESIGDVIGSPIKYAKIKNNAKKYQKALVQKSLLDVDYEKKRVAGIEPEKREVLKAATNAKKSSLNDLISSIGDRMDSLATTEPLKKVVSLAKSKAKVSAAETSLKTADAEETKQLKARIKELNQKAASIQQDLKKEEPKAEEPKKETATEKKERERKETISKKIEDTMLAIQKAESDKKVAQEEKTELVSKLKDVKGTESEPTLASEVAAADKSIKDIDDAIAEFKQNVKDLRKELKE